MKDAYPKGLKWNCKRAYSCATLAKRNKCGKKYVQAMSRSCSNQIPKWFQNQVVNKFCKKSCTNCMRKYIAIYTFELYIEIIQVDFATVLKLQILSLITVLLADGIDAWDNDYIKFNMKKLESEYGVNGENKIKFRVFSTKQDCTYRNIDYNEDTQTASLKDESFFDKNLKLKIIAHGNGGCWKTADFFCNKYAQVEGENDKHYNVIGICWGKGRTNKHAYAGIKLAMVVKSFVEKYGIEVSSIHGIGFRYITIILQSIHKTYLKN